MREYLCKKLSKRQLSSKRKPTCEFGTGMASGAQINICRKPALYLVYWREKDGKLCTTPAYGCEECIGKVSEKNEAYIF